MTAQPDPSADRVIPPIGPWQPVDLQKAPGGPGPRRRGWAVPIAVAAVLVACVSLMVAGFAVARAEDARDIALRAGQPAGQPAGASPGANLPTGPADASPPETPAYPTVTTPPRPLDNQTVYELKYQKVNFRLQEPSSCNSRGIDLDLPSASTSSSIDMSFAGPCAGPSGFTFSDGVDASEADSPTVTPTACAAQIQLSPIDGDTPFAARKGRVLCILTSLDQAGSEGDSRKMIVLEILGVGADDTVTMQVTAWAVPR